MNPLHHDFPEIESVKAVKRTLAAKAMAALIFAGTAVGIIKLQITVMESETMHWGLKIFSVLLLGLVLSFMAYAVLKGAAESRKNKITRIAVDRSGLHHYKADAITGSLAFESLRPNPNPEDYDVKVNEGEDTTYIICVYYLDEAANITSLKALTLNTPFSIRNAEELQRHFIKGILKFRPDLKVSPKVLDLLDMKEYKF